MRASSRSYPRRKCRPDGFGRLMVIMHNHPLHLTLTPLLFGLGASACTNTGNPTVINSACVVDPVTVDCTTDGFSAEALGLVPYSCTGESRPDQDPTYIDGVPQGLVCANQGAAGSDGSQGYCCSSRAVPCAYNPVAICDSGTYGYQCRGADRPEALNDAIHCNQGVRQDDLVNYCCTGPGRQPEPRRRLLSALPRPDACAESRLQQLLLFHSWASSRRRHLRAGRCGSQLPAGSLWHRLLRARQARRGLSTHVLS